METLHDLGTQAQLWMWAGIGIGLLLAGAVGGLAAWQRSERAFPLGALVFLLCMGLPAATGSARLAAEAVAVQERTVPARGRLLGYEVESAAEAVQRRRPRGRGAQKPRVAFTTPAGQRVEFLGLGGSRSGLAVGSEVPVRHDPVRPEDALVADFQTLWGPAWALGAFATFALSGAAVLAAGLGARRGAAAGVTAGLATGPMTKSQRRAARQRQAERAAMPAAPAAAASSPPTPAPPPPRQRVADAVHAVGIVLLLLAVPAPVITMQARALQVVSVVFAAVAAGLVCLVAAHVLRQRGGAEAAGWPWIPSLLALNFGYFALGGWLFTRA
jgi:Protein of unknown function (DUF3592)